MPRRDPPDPVNAARVPVAIYARVSTDNQVGGRFDSCESQAAVCRDHIRKQSAEGWYEVASFTDAAYSGGTMDRPGIQALKRMIAAGEVKVVLIFKLERVSRNMDEWGPFRAFLQKHGCRLESATENISELEPEGRLKNNIMMSVAEFERLNTAKKTRLKMREQAKRGYWNGGQVPYGYSYDKNTQALLPHPTEGPILKRIFSEAAKLTSLTDLANALNAEGHRTKPRTFQRRDGTLQPIGARLFRSDGLRLLIRNPIYRGAVKFEGQEFSGKHTPLVDLDLWERANAAVAETQERPGRSLDHPLFQARDIHNHLLKGIAWCATCNRALVPTDSGKKSVSGIKYRYYACSSILRESQAPCSVGRLPADALEKSVVSILGEASKHPAIIKEIIDVSRNTQSRDSKELRSEIEKTKQAIAVIEKQVNNCADAIAQGGVDVLGDALVRRAAQLREDRRRILVKQEKLRQELAVSDMMVMDEERVRKNLEQFSELLPKLTAAEQKELVGLFIVRVELRRVTQPVRKRSVGTFAANDGARIMELRLKLHDTDLVERVKDKLLSTSKSHVGTPRLQGLGLEARVDFSNASRDEIGLITPFQKTVRLSERVGIPTAEKAVIEHPIIRARKWQRMLDVGTVANRIALATQVGVDPAMVTRILRLLDLAPPIQDYLAKISTASGAWYFNIRTLGRLAGMSAEAQLQEFASIANRYCIRIQRIAPGIHLPGFFPHAQTHSVREAKRRV